MTQTSHPEATMINAWKAFITCCISDPNKVAHLHDVNDEPEWANAAAGATPFHYLPQTFDRATYQLKLPSFLQDNVSTPITLTDVVGLKKFDSGQRTDLHGRRAELHLLYCKLPGLCNSCTDNSSCNCLTYDQLWDKFLQDTGRASPTKHQLPAALNAWWSWAMEQEDLSESEIELCFGPERSVMQYDRAIIGNSKIAGIRVEQAKFARDSLVMTESDGKFWAGRVCAFLLHSPPASLPLSPVAPTPRT